LNISSDHYKRLLQNIYNQFYNYFQILIENQFNF